MEANRTNQRVMQLKLKTTKAPPETVRSDTAKVKVQFIHQQIVDKATDAHQLNSKQPTEPTEEVENVEYLDECSGEETVLPASPHFKDTFYPNAIHCLIALYRSKYEKLDGKTQQQIMAMSIWDQIALEMNESFFEFNSEQVKHKFRQLRQQYFSVATPSEIEDFEYFDHLHEIYQDKAIQAIAAGERRQQTAKPPLQQVYPDDILQQDNCPEEEPQSESPVYDAATALPYQTTSHEVEVVTQQHDEIAHKEHEFIDMVEKELQAIEEGNANARAPAEQQQTEGAPPTTISPPQNEEFLGNNEIIHHQEENLQHESQREVLLVPSQAVYIKREQSEVNDTSYTNAKRVKLEASSMPAIVRAYIETKTPQHQPPQSQATAEIRLPISVSPTANLFVGGGGSSGQDISSLADYNAARERRHQEKMALLRQSLQLQERAMEMQQHLMEELIKRL